MTQVFLSHSTVDADFALQLATDLRSAGVPVWKAPESILDGEEWVAAIERGLTTSSHLLLLKSPAAVNSKWVKFEFNAALTLEKRGRMRIIPVDYQPCNPPLFWTQFQHVSGIHEEYHATLFKILARLRQEQPADPPEPTFASTTIQVTVHGSVTGQLNVAGNSINYAGQPEAPPPAAPVVTAESEPEPPTRCDFEPEMVLIPAGLFLMGSPKSDELRYDDEPEQFELDLDYDYAVGKYLVTVREFAAFIDAGGYSNPDYWTDAGWKQRESDDWAQPRYWDDDKWVGDDMLPVVGVSWYEVYAYTRWLAKATGRNYRLLTEAEWEKAARGGLQIPDGRGGMKKNPIPARTWPWGDAQPTSELCNFEGNVGQTSVVTSHEAQAKAQPYGLYHMAGNVWEWCLSKWADPFIYSEDYNPEGDSPRVLRGGSWIDINSRMEVRCSYRLRGDPLDWSDFGGFRVGGVVPVLE